MAEINLIKEETINVNLASEKPINAQVQDINYIPSYKFAEEERRTNELERIANENEREAYYEEIQEKVNSGEMDGKNTVYVGTEKPTDDFYDVWIDPNGTPEVSADNLVFNDNETLQDKYDNGELKGEKGDTPLKGTDYFTEEDINSLNIPTKVSELENDSNFASTSYVDNEIATFDFIKVVSELPETGLDNRIYFVPKADTQTQDLFDEYVWINGAWEWVTTKQLEVDLTPYYTKEEVNAKTENLEACINGDKSMGSIVVEDVECKNLLPVAETETITLSKRVDVNLPAGTYTLSVESISSNGTTGSYVFAFVGTDGAEKYFYLRNDLLEVTFYTSVKLTKCSIYSEKDWTNSQNVTTTYTRLMIEKGNTKTEYVPYKKIGYNSNESMGKIIVDDVTCKNLFNAYSDYDYSTGSYGASYYIYNPNKISVSSAGGNWSRIACRMYGLKPNKSYTISSVITNSAGLKCGLITTAGSSKQYLSDEQSFKAIIIGVTNSSGELYFEFYHNYSSTSSSDSVIFDKIQVELGDVASEYVPYKNFDNTCKNDVLFGFSHINSGTTYTLTNGKKFSDYRFLEFSSEKQTIIKSRDTWEPFWTKGVELRWYENIENGRTELVVEIEYVSDTEFRCIKSGYCAYDRNICEDNPYPIIIRGII